MAKIIGPVRRTISGTIGSEIILSVRALALSLIVLIPVSNKLLLELWNSLTWYFI